MALEGIVDHRGACVAQVQLLGMRMCLHLSMVDSTKYSTYIEKVSTGSIYFVVFK